jgi:hypothetical protein
MLETTTKSQQNDKKEKEKNQNRVRRLGLKRDI